MRQRFVSFVMVNFRREVNVQRFDSAVESIRVYASVKCGRVRIIDLQGKAVTRWLDRQQLEGSLSSGVERQLHWQEATQRLAWRGVSRKHSAAQSPWEAKAATLAASFRLRGRMRARDPKPRGRRLFECYRTLTWDDAIGRMWHQANNRHRRIARTDWARWACTVANNHNKRKGGRYGQTCDGHGQDDHAAH